MKLSHLLPIAGVVAGCSSITPPPNPPEVPRVLTLPERVEPKEQLVVCTARVDHILTYSYGDGLDLLVVQPDACLDPLGAFLFQEKILRSGQLTFTPKGVLPKGVRHRVIELLVLKGEKGGQEIFLSGKQEKGPQGKGLIRRIDDLQKNGSLEKD